MKKITRAQFYKLCKKHSIVLSVSDYYIEYFKLSNNTEYVIADLGTNLFGLRGYWKINLNSKYTVNKLNEYYPLFVKKVQVAEYKNKFEGIVNAK